MLENIQVINKNGDGMFTEGIAYIRLISTGKKYLFYTLNEKVDNDLTKIYIAETNESPENLGHINDSEWDDLRKKMVMINHKEEVSDVEYLNMNDVVFNVGEPKKLAVTSVAKQTFKDAQTSHTLVTNQTDTPVMTGTTEFFNHDVVEPNKQEVSTESGEQSIFANPPQPEVVNNQVGIEPTPVVSTPITSEPVGENIVNEPEVGLTNSVPTEPNVITNTPVSPQESVVPTNTVINQTVIPTTETVPTMPVETSGLNEPIISDEEALRAINIIQDYIDQEKN